MMPPEIWTGIIYRVDIQTVLIPGHRQITSQEKMQNMQSVIQKESFDSVKIFWLDRIELRRRLKNAASRILEDDHLISKVILFGSVAEGRATPASDVDIVIVTEESDKRFMDRSMDFLDYFSDIDLSVDIFVYAGKEIENNPPPIYLTAVKTGILLAERTVSP